MFGSEGWFPKSLIQFQGRFASESECAEYLFERRWPHGFVCPGHCSQLCRRVTSRCNDHASERVRLVEIQATRLEDKKKGKIALPQYFVFDLVSNGRHGFQVTLNSRESGQSSRRKIWLSRKDLPSSPMILTFRRS